MGRDRIFVALGVISRLGLRCSPPHTSESWRSTSSAFVRPLSCSRRPRPHLILQSTPRVFFSSSPSHRLSAASVACLSALASSDSQPVSSDLPRRAPPRRPYHQYLSVSRLHQLMLQYSAQPIPLPISYKSQLARKDILPEHRSNDSPNQPSRLFNKRFTKDRSSRPSQQRQQQQPPFLSHVNYHSPHSISAPLPTSSPVPSPLPSPLPLPSLLSPAPASPLSLPSPLPSAPLPLPPSSSIRPYTSRSATSARRSTSGSSIIEDVLAPGDFIGQGIILQDHHIRVSPAPVSHDSPDFGLAQEFEVVRKLGTGSYAVVYLVREVLSRAQPSEDGHCGTLDLGDLTRSKSYVTYGRNFALKCLSKANLDQDALAAQMTEVSPRGNLIYAPYSPSHTGHYPSVSSSPSQHRDPLPHI